MKLGTLALGVALCLGLSIAPRSAGAKAFHFVVAAGHTPSFLWVEMLRDEFIPEVDRRLAERGEHSIRWTQAYGGTVAKLGGVLESVEVGLVEIGFVATVFEAPKLPLQNITYMTPFGPDDPRMIAKVLLDLQREVPAMQDAFGDHNTVFLAATTIENYDLYTREPVRRFADLQGRKLLAPGPAANWLRGTGAVAVSGDLSTYYNDLSTGVADGVLTIATGAWGSKLFEVVPYRTPVGLGAQFVGAVVINRKMWRSLPSEVQTIFEEVGVAFSERQAEAQQARAEEVLRAMHERGLTTLPFPVAEREAWARALPDVAGHWARQLDARGLRASEVLRVYTQRVRAHGFPILRSWGSSATEPRP